MMRRCCFVIVVGAIASTAPVQAAVLNVVSSRDNTMYDDPTGSLSNGAGQFCFVGTTGTGLRRRALLQFDVGGVPAGATINSVTLSLHMSMTAFGATDVSVFRALSNWGEGTSVAPGNGGAGTAATPGDATWLHTFFNTNLWTTPGGDFAAASSATTSVNAIGTYTWSSAQLIADVQQWITSPAINFGWVLRGDETTLNASKRFDTRENATVAFRPTLIIDYTAIPAPGALASLLGGLAVVRRRRR